MATIEVLLNNLDEVVENSMGLPMSGGRSIVDTNRIMELIDDIRLQLPNEIKQAKAVVSDRNEILAIAKKDAESLVRKAEERAKALVDQDTIVRQANQKALAIINEANQKANELLAVTNRKTNELTAQTTSKATETLTQATVRSREMKQAAYDFSESSLQSAEVALANALAEVQNTRRALKASASQATVR